MKNLVYSESFQAHPARSQATLWHALVRFMTTHFSWRESARDVELASIRAQLDAAHRVNLRLRQQLAAASLPTEAAALVQLAYTDCLTGLSNRHAMQIAAQREQLRIQRTGRPACLLMVDIDHFKQINDQHGHAAGDEILRQTADTLVAHTRGTDIVARWGGEEFVLLLPETDLAAARLVAEKCRIAVQNGLAKQGVTITVGAGSLLSKESLELALKRADAALYQGKRAGRNRVIEAP